MGPTRPRSFIHGGDVGLLGFDVVRHPLNRNRALANSAKAAPSLWPPITARIMARPDAPITSATQVRLDAAVLEHLGDPGDTRGVLVDEYFAVPDQVT
jgi:hypothetical protein